MSKAQVLKEQIFSDEWARVLLPELEGVECEVRSVSMLSD